MITARRPDLEARLDDLGLVWSFDTVPLAAIDDPASAAQQYRIEQVNQATVDQYAADMAHGDEFPALLCRRVRSKLVLLGGMHRRAAAVTAGHTTAACYIVTTTAALGRRLAFEDNRTHGLPLSTAERGELAARLVELDGYTQTQAAELVGVNKVAVQSAVAARQAAARAAAVGVDLSDISPSARARLNGITTPDLFNAAVEVVAGKHMSTTSVTRLVTRILAAPTPEDAFDEIDSMAAGYVRGTPGHGVRRHARGRLIDAVLELLDCPPDQVAEGLTGRDAEIMSDRLLRAAKHLMAIDKAIRS